MKRLKIAMMSMTHGHTRKYYDVLKNNPKLDWVAVSTANDEVKEIFLNSVQCIPCYDSDEAMLDAHPEIEAVVLASEKESEKELYFRLKEMVEYISNVKAYERHAVKAAINGDKLEAMRALAVNPLVGDLKSASECFDEMVEAHKEFLPQFCKEEK